MSSNVVKRFFNNLFFKQPQTLSLPDSNDIVAYKYNSIGGSRFDLTRPELSSTVYSCVSLIANNISKLKLNVYKKTAKGREIYSAHPWQRTLSYQPDLRISTAKWLNYTVTKMLIEGGAFFYRSDFDSSLQTRKELKAMGAAKAISSYGDEVFYKFENVPDRWIPSKDLVYFSIFSRDGVVPISPIEAIRNELDIQHGAESTIKNFYQNGLFQILYVEADIENGIADKTKAKEYFERLEREVTGSQNAFAGGLLRVPPMYRLKSIPLPDLKFLEASRYTEARVCAIYHVPAWMLNINEGSTSNYSKVEAQQVSFLNNCLSNITNILLAELNDKLLSVEERESGIHIDFDYHGLYTLDLESKSLYLKNLASIGSISPNEIREQFGMEKIDNEFMNGHFIQSQWQIVEKYDMWGNNKIKINGSESAPGTGADNESI